MKVSVIIVYYHSKDPLFACLNSLKATKNKTSYEVTVVDNDEKKTIDKEIKKKYPWITYIKTSSNLGFGVGNNLGAKEAKGEYLFFLNPDTVVFSKTIDILAAFLDNNKDAAIVAPLLLDLQRKPYSFQGVSVLTPLRGIIGLSFINKIFPNNPISKKYWLKGWDKTKQKEVDVIPGTAFMIRRDVFEKIGGFDEKFFLYFEEFDLCKRILEKGYQIFIEPKSKLIHLWGKGGTGEVNNVDRIFVQSRFYYFKKHYGLSKALLVNNFLSLGRLKVCVIGVLLLAAFLLFYRLSELMPFIGDQGFFYLSARDMLLTGQIPLVGITSSHTWLHQGPLWTYMLGGALWLSHFNPVSGAYLTAAIGLFTIWLVYKIGSEMFSQRVGVIASLCYATLPLIISFARMPYHTEPIAPLTLLLFYAMYKWIKGYHYGFPMIMFLFALLYNFELSTSMLVPIFLIVFIYGMVRKEKWIRDSFNKKIILLSFLVLLIPMIPMILYDMHHGYPQTVKFVVWVGYKIATVFGFPKIHPDAHGETYLTMLPFASVVIQRMLFLKSALIAWIILGTCFINLLFINKENFKKKEFLQSYSLLLLFFSIPALAYIAEKTNSDAYWIVFFPTISFMLALVFDRFMNFRKLFYPAVCLLLLLVSCNIMALFQTNFLTISNKSVFLEQINGAKEIIRESKGQKYNIIGGGPKPWSQYPNFTMNYQYLTWWLGDGPSTHKEKIRFVIFETPTKTIIKKEIRK